MEAWTRSAIEKVIGQSRVASATDEVRALGVQIMAGVISYPLVVKLLGGRKPNPEGESAHAEGCWGETGTAAGAEEGDWKTHVPAALKHLGDIVGCLYGEGLSCLLGEEEGFGLKAAADTAIAAGLSADNIEKLFVFWFQAVAHAMDRVRTVRGAVLPDWVATGAEAIRLKLSPAVRRQENAAESAAVARATVSQIMAADARARAGARASRTGLGAHVAGRVHHPPQLGREQPGREECGAALQPRVPPRVQPRGGDAVRHPGAHGHLPRRPRLPHVRGPGGTVAAYAGAGRARGARQVGVRPRHRQPHRMMRHGGSTISISSISISSISISSGQPTVARERRPPRRPTEATQGPPSVARPALPQWQRRRVAQRRGVPPRRRHTISKPPVSPRMGAAERRLRRPVPPVRPPWLRHVPPVRHVAVRRVQGPALRPACTGRTRSRPRASTRAARPSRSAEPAERRPRRAPRRGRQRSFGASGRPGSNSSSHSTIIIIISNISSPRIRNSSRPTAARARRPPRRTARPPPWRPWQPPALILLH